MNTSKAEILSLGSNIAAQNTSELEELAQRCEELQKTLANVNF